MKTKICSYCVMDDQSDPTITFDENGECNYCRQARSEFGITGCLPKEEGEKRVTALVEKLKKEGKGKEYDCLMGISGGLDSSYLAYLGYKWGLRILAVHIDDGFDTDISKQNISKLVQAAQIKLVNIQPDAEQFYDLSKSFLKAGVPDIAVPQDNVLFGALYSFAKKYHIKSFLSGGNYATESITQKGNSGSAYDLVNIKDIHRKFGTKPINKLPFISYKKRIIDDFFFHIKTYKPLNFVDYNRNKAFKELSDFCGFQYYGSKHLENIYTAFVQLYWLPQKFNLDKRKSHFSSLIVSGQMTRNEALSDLEKPSVSSTQLDQYVQTVKQKLGLTDEEFIDIMNQKSHQHTDYKTDALIPLITRLLVKRKH